MFHNGPSCLKGPLSGAHRWWSAPVVGAEHPIRQHLVERIRAEIAAGSYETPQKWEAALDRLLRHLEAE